MCGSRCRRQASWCAVATHTPCVHTVCKEQLMLLCVCVVSAPDIEQGQQRSLHFNATFARQKCCACLGRTRSAHVATSRDSVGAATREGQIAMLPKAVLEQSPGMAKKPCSPKPSWSSLQGRQIAMLPQSRVQCVGHKALSKRAVLPRVGQEALPPIAALQSAGQRVTSHDAASLCAGQEAASLNAVSQCSGQVAVSRKAALQH